MNRWYRRVFKLKYVRMKTQIALDQFKIMQKRKKPNAIAMFNKTYGYRFFVSCMYNLIQQLAGINYLAMFSTEIFNKLSGNGALITIVISVSNLVGGILGSFTVGKFGRRINMVYGSFLQVIGWTLVAYGKFKSLQNKF